MIIQFVSIQDVLTDGQYLSEVVNTAKRALKLFSSSYLITTSSTSVDHRVDPTTLIPMADTKRVAPAKPTNYISMKLSPVTRTDLQ